MQCNAFVKNRRCSKRSIIGSRYCLYHQDKIPVLVGFLIGILASLLVGLYFDKKPDIKVDCYLVENNYCSIECVAKNEGRKQSINTRISFSYLFPKGTEVVAKNHIYDIFLKESKYIPDPNFFSEADKIFGVIISSIPSKEKVSFVIRTIDKDNIKACEYLVKLMDKQKIAIRNFGEKLKSEQPELYKNWDNEKIISARVKKANLYRPSEVVFEEGIRKVNFLTDEEIDAYDKSAELTNKYSELIDVVETYNLPVFSVNTSLGDKLFQLFPSYVKFIADLNKTKVLDFSSLDTNQFEVISKDIRRYRFFLIQPESYD